ncbi:hypothetical protein JMG10_45825 [Nostoc ellipsosporum NOK]|nr:hypothetical protein [Nostoc ellipsosporum NOK]
MSKPKTDNKFFINLKSGKLLSLGVLGAISSCVIVVYLPSWVVQNAKITDIENRLAIANSYRATIIQGLGGLFFFSTAFFTWKNLKVAEANLQVTQEKQNLDAKVAEANLKAIQDKQITEQFAKAVEMLGHPDIHVRLGAIYALERISKNSKQDYWEIMEP